MWLRRKSSFQIEASKKLHVVKTIQGTQQCSQRHFQAQGLSDPKDYEVRVKAGTEKHATQDTKEDLTKSDEEKNILMWGTEIKIRWAAMRYPWDGVRTKLWILKKVWSNS